MTSQNTPVEETRCGSCSHFEKDCPHGTTRSMGKVYPFFAEKCSSYEEKVVTQYCQQYPDCGDCEFKNGERVS